ncbi:ArsR family transcriptional regulator, partial [Erysipelothrix rhusiopathiae]|nr:ArsR family transcriptional regulator [Erysipelothrix rhusiopathiae]MDE8247198.1 ArsR family transcriptional regulator [Erysipelothrix rhusiopathiae]
NGWIDRFMRDGKEGLKNKKKTGNHFSALHTSKSLTEIERLQLEILKRDIEIARLKKGYQVKGVGVNKAFVTLKDKNPK